MIKIHKLVKQIAFVMHREENDRVIFAFWYFQYFFNSYWFEFWSVSSEISRFAIWPKIEHAVIWRKISVFLEFGFDLYQYKDSLFRLEEETAAIWR